MHRCICDCMLEAVQNSIEANASEISVSVGEKDGMLLLDIRDNGRGMDEATLAKALDPFYTEPGKHSSRRVGLGLPFLVQQVGDSGGKVNITSKPGVGTSIECSYDMSNIDTPPLGDVASTAISSMSFIGEYELIFSRTTVSGEYRVARSELRDALGEIMSASSIKLARQYVESMENSLFQPRGEHGC